MAGDWVVWDKGLHRKSKILRIAKAIGRNNWETAARFMAMYEVFDEQTVDGHWIGGTPELVDEAVGLPGFFAAAVSVDWAVVTPEGVAMPRWESHDYESSKRRVQKRDQKRAERMATFGRPNGRHLDDTKTTPVSVSVSVLSGPVSPDSSGGEIHPNGASTVAQPPTGNAPTVAVTPPPCPPSPSVGDVGRPGGSDATGGIVDEVSKHKQPAPPSSAERYLAEREHKAGRFPAFDRFYAEYNRKTGNRAMSQNKALLAWTANDLEADADTIIEGVRRWAECDQWRRGVVESAANFLTDRQWERPPPTEVKDGPPDLEAAKATARAKADKMIREATEYAEEKARKKLEAAR